MFRFLSNKLAVIFEVHRVFFLVAHPSFRFIQLRVEEVGYRNDVPCGTGLKFVLSGGLPRFYIA